MIDENLIRADLSDAIRALQTGRRKEIYETLHPDAKHGGDRKSDGARSTRQNGELIRFTAATSKATGRAERSVQRDAQHGEKIVHARAALYSSTSCLNLVCAATRASSNEG